MTRDEIANLLPEAYRRGLQPGTPLFALLSSMEALLAPRQAAIESLPETFDPFRAPEAFVNLLAHWSDLDRFMSGTGGDARLSSGFDQLRILIAASPQILRRRGTARGLTMMLELATGAKGIVVDDRAAGPDGALRPFHMRIFVPPEAAVYRELIDRIIEAEKPAHVTYEVFNIVPALDNVRSGVKKDGS